MGEESPDARGTGLASNTIRHKSSPDADQSLSSGIAIREPWTRAEGLLAVMVVVLCAFFLFYKADYSGAWDGDPSIHAMHAMQTVNVFSQEWNNNGQPSKAFLQSYFAFPKMMHEIMLSSFTLLINGIKNIDYGEIEYFGAWFATAFAALGAVVLWLSARRFANRTATFLATPMFVLGGYFLLYANFPRHNMPSHALIWLVWFCYLCWRSQRPVLRVRHAVVLGLVFGFTVPVHYSSAYFLFAVLLSELALLFVDRGLWKRAFGSWCGMGLAALVVPGLLETYFHLYTALFPMEVDPWGNVIASKDYSFLDGMLRVIGNLQNQKMGWKLLERDLLFFPGFLVRAFGAVGFGLILIGAMVLVLKAIKLFRSHANSGQLRAAIIVLSTFVVGILVSFEFFQNARKLAPYYPAWAILLTVGLAATYSHCQAWIAQKGQSDPGSEPLSRGNGLRTALPAVIALLGVYLLHIVTYGPELWGVWHARRDTGFMRAYLEDKGIPRILTMPQYVASQMAPAQVAMRRSGRAPTRTKLSETEDFEYVVFHRLYLGSHKKPLMDCIRQFRPIVAFPNQVSLPLFYYEFPLKPSFMDPRDPLTTSRALYSWPEIRDACSDQIIARGFLVDDRSTND